MKMPAKAHNPGSMHLNEAHNENISIYGQANTAQHEPAGHRNK
jgi:hypothetical protein